MECVMTDETLADVIREKCTSGDKELDHYHADTLVIAMLRDLGFNQTADAWEAVDKWYA